MFRRTIFLLISGVVFLAACSDNVTSGNGTSPEDDRTETWR